MKIDLPRHLYGALPELREGSGSEVLRLELGRNLTRGLADALGRGIASGRYDREPFPTERALTRQYAVSLSVAREAVKMLTAKGMLGAHTRQGTAPQPVARWNLFDSEVLHWLVERPRSHELLLQFNQLRMAVEPEAAALAASRPFSDDDRPIVDSLARLSEAGDRLDVSIAFHAAVLRASNNPFYLQFRELVATALRASAQLADRTGRRAVSLADYAATGEAILSRDAGAARTAMLGLLTNTVAACDTPAPGDGARRSKR